MVQVWELSAIQSFRVRPVTRYEFVECSYDGPRGDAAVDGTSSAMGIKGIRTCAECPINETTRTTNVSGQLLPQIATVLIRWVE